MTTIGLAGLSHLGLVTAAALAARGLRVVAFDPDAPAVLRIAHGDLPVVEPGLPELLAPPAGPQFTSNAEDLAGCDLVFVALDVATDEAGHSDLAPLAALLDAVWPQVGRQATVVVLSQVPPGFTRELARARMTADDRPAALYYMVETLIFGRAVERAVAPERFIVGCDDPSHALTTALADVLGRFQCPILPMRYESAELAKLSINCFLASSISTTNLLAECCEQVGAEWDEIAAALRLDRRIGEHAYLQPGLGIGGGNLRRDLVTIERLAAERGTDARIIDAWRRNSAYRRDWPLRVLRTTVLARVPEAAVAVWGLAYKEHTASTTHSPAVALLESLDGRPLAVFDPAAELPERLQRRVRHAADAVSACRDADVLCVMTPWPLFRDVPLAAVANVMRGRVLVDPNGIIDRQAAAAHGFVHHRLGSPAPDGVLAC